jgi:hypothetical protein
VTAGDPVEVIAGRLLAALQAAARDRGLRTLVAEVLPENAQMLAVLREHGPCRERLRDGVVHVEVPVDATVVGEGVDRAVALC